MGRSNTRRQLDLQTWRCHDVGTGSERRRRSETNKEGFTDSKSGKRSRERNDAGRMRLWRWFDLAMSRDKSKPPPLSGYYPSSRVMQLHQIDIGINQHNNHVPQMRIPICSYCKVRRQQSQKMTFSHVTCPPFCTSLAPTASIHQQIAVVRILTNREYCRSNSLLFRGSR